MSEVLAVLQSSSLPITGPRLEVIEGGGETTPVIGTLALAPLSREDCLLADVDDLARYRTPDGLSYELEAVASVRQNKVTRVKEGAIPAAVSEVAHEWLASPEGRGGIIRDLGRTAVQTAMRGRDLFYHYDESRARGDVEVAYAAHNQENLRPGIAHMMIAPRMTSHDAPAEVAKAEGLDETDSIQINWLGLDESSEKTVAKTASILVADIPLPAWTDMLADPNNIVGKSIPVDKPESALAVMKVFRELELPNDKLPEGPVSILAAVLPHIQDPEAKQKVTEQLTAFRGDQEEMHRLAISPAERWLQFDEATDQSLHWGVVTSELQTFMDSLESNWGDEDLDIIEGHKILAEGRLAYRMSRELAKVLQKAASHLILTSAAVVTRNQKVLDQMSTAVAERIYEDEIALSQTYSTGLHSGLIATANNSLIASQNTKVGGGCCPTLQAKFRTDGTSNIGDLLTLSPEAEPVEANEALGWHGGRVKEGTCDNCDEHTEVGVKNWCKPCIKYPISRKKAA